MDESDPFPNVPFAFVEPPDDEQTNKDLTDLLTIVLERSKRFENAFDRSKYMHGLLALGLCYVLQQHSGPAGILFAQAIRAELLEASCRAPVE